MPCGSITTVDNLWTNLQTNLIKHTACNDICLLISPNSESIICCYNVTNIENNEGYVIV